MPIQPSELVLSTLSGSCERERLLVVLCHEVGAGSRIELRQQSFGDGVGWFTQSSVCLEPHQVADLRNVLGTGQASGRRSQLPKQFSHVSTSGFSPRVVHADSA
jgi:hypothetical protein